MVYFEDNKVRLQIIRLVYIFLMRRISAHNSFIDCCFCICRDKHLLDHGQITLFIILQKVLLLASEEVYASTGSSIIVYNKEFAELKKMSRINGLTETGISTIAWSEENKTLIIAYTSTNVDLLKNNIIYNIPDISRKYIPGKKEINRIRTNGKFAYLACSFGIVVVDIIKKEIYDTWKPGTGSENAEVWDIAFGNGKIYAATGNGSIFC